MDRKIKIGIIGTGGMASAHVEHFGKIEGVEIISCYDIFPEKAAEFAAKHQIQKVAPTVEDLLSDVEAVSIVTSDSSHAELTLKSLAADKHTLCEKPLTVTIEEASAVAAAARAASGRGIINMVNFSYRSSAAFQEAIRLVKSGVLGEIRHVHSFYLQQWLAGKGVSTDNISPAALWRLSTAMGSTGVLGDLGCHILDLTTACSEDFAKLRCELRTFPKKVDGQWSDHAKEWPLDANDTALIEFELVGGGVGVCHTTRWASGHGNHLRLGVHGTEGAFTLDLSADPNAIDLCLGEDRFKKPWETEYTTQKLEPTPSNWARFITSIRTGVQDQPDMIRGAQVQAYLETCMRSAKTGTWETVLEA